MHYDDGAKFVGGSVNSLRGLRGAGLIGAAWLCGVIVPSYGQAANTAQFPRGQVIDAVACKLDPGQSYALYLPSSYTPAKLWPIVYLFDPGAEGGLPVQLYREIAEKYGFVIAGSNTSRNFGSDTSRSMTAIWQDTHSRLALDEHRSYSSGFSGGARVAGSMALGCSRCQIAGVIAHGAGYPTGRRLDAKDALFYFFAIGEEDFNWPEVVAIRREREDADLAYRVEVFSGSHQWAPPEVMEQAIEWMILKAIQARNQVRDGAFIDRAWLRAQQDASDAEKRNDAIARLSAYRALVSDFKGLKDVAPYQSKLADVKRSAELKAALKKERDLINEQVSLESEISTKLETLVEGKVKDPTTLQRGIEQAMSRLRDQSTRGKSEEKRRVAARALYAVWVQGIEMGQMQVESRHFETAELCFSLMSAVNDNPWPILLLAETHTAQGNRKQAIKDLREAVRRGLKDPKKLDKDDKLQALKTDAEFQKIVEGLKSNK
jgi:dienelactone hydrolase